MSQYSATPAANDVSTKLTTTNDTLIQALFIFHSEGEAACVSMFPQYGRAEIIKKLMEICQQSNTGLLSLDNNTGAEMVGNKLLKMNSLNDTLIQALFIFHSEGEAACVSMFPQYSKNNEDINEIIKKLVEIICKETQILRRAGPTKTTGLLALDNNDAEMVGKELLKMNKFNLYCCPATPFNVSNVAPLATLVNLTWLSLSGNQIVDVAPLATLVNLTVLHLDNNEIVNMAPLTTLVNLKDLNLDGNQIVDVAPLATLVNLTVLCLDRNKIVNVAPLAALFNLKHLFLQGNPIVDTNPLRSLPKTTKIEGPGVRGSRDLIFCTLNFYLGKLKNIKFKWEFIITLVILIYPIWITWSWIMNSI